MTTLAATPSARRDRLLDWGLAVGLTLFGWAQLALVAVWMSTPGGAVPPLGPRPSEMIPRPDLIFFQDVSAPTWVAFVLVALATLPLGLRRRFPVPVLGVSLLVATAYDLLRQPPVMVAVAPLIALYTVGTLVERKTLVWTTAVAVAIALAGVLPGQQVGRILAEAARVTATFAFAAALGDATRNRRAYIAEVEQRAVEAERTREEEARRRVEAERVRIARELHDVTAHSLSIIAVQAGAGQRVVESDPDAARRVFETIRTTSKASLDELRAILGVLRSSDDDAPLAPAGSIARIVELAAAVEEAGVSVEVVAGELGDVPAFVEVSAYRIVQEALTNVMRHSGAHTAVVTLERVAEALRIEITDDGTAAAATPESGHGIAGMRERVAALGGEFSAGPRAGGGGFVVSATIPLTGGPQ